MVTTVLVVIPVLNRPHRVQPLLDSLNASKGKIPVEHLFVASTSDTPEVQALMKANARFLLVDREPGPADYAQKINEGVLEAEDGWVLAAADDLVFHDRWADEAIRVADRSGMRFIATNDLGNPLVQRGRHATHPLVHISYLPLAVADAPGLLYSEQYDHSCCDVEASETAMRRHEFAYAPRSIVEHQHVIWRKSPDDATYMKGQRHLLEDKKLLEQRRRLWQNLRPDRPRHLRSVV